MDRSVQPSFTIDSVLANLSESTEIDCSDDGIQFSEMVQKYQDETQALQSILNSLYQQIDKSISPSIKKNGHQENNAFQYTEINDIQERLKLLEKENEELSIQMKRFATMSDASSFQINNSKKYQPINRNDELNSITFSDSKYQTNSTNLSKNQPINDWETKYNEQLAHNMQLTSELNKQKDINEQLLKQQRDILSNLLSITNLPKKKGMDDISQIDNALSYLSKYVNACNSQRKLIHQLFFDISDQKMKIDEMMNSFKKDILNLRFSAIHQIQNQKMTKSYSKTENTSNYSFKTKNISKLTSETSISRSQAKSNADSSMVVRGCEELIDSISTNFNGIQKMPLNELINNPREFGKYINLVRSHLDMNIQSLKRENDDLSRNLSSANDKIKAATVSPEIKNTIDNVMSLITKVTREMKNEHQELLAQLG